VVRGTDCIGAYAVRNPGPVYNIIYVSVIIIYSDVRNPGPVNDKIYVNVIIIYSDVRNTDPVNNKMYVNVIVIYSDVRNPGPVNNIIYVNVIIIYYTSCKNLLIALDNRHLTFLNSFFWCRNQIVITPSAVISPSAITPSRAELCRT